MFQNMYLYSLNQQVCFGFVLLQATTCARKTFLVLGRLSTILFCFNLTLISFMFSSDPYVRIDLVAVNGDDVIDSVMTRTKKRVCFVIHYLYS